MHSHPEWPLLIANIAARPDDDATRLVVADWLDDHGDPARAEFIRVQIELARTDDPARRRMLFRVMDELEFAHEGAWLGPWRLRLLDWIFERGFLSSVRMTAGQFLEYGEELFQFEPVQQLVLAWCNDQEARWVATHPAFRHVRSLNVTWRNRIDFLEALATSPHVSNLQEIHGSAPLKSIPASESVDAKWELQVLRSICRSPRLSSLRAFDLHSFHVGGQRLIDELAGATFASKLRDLDLRNCNLGAKAIRSLAECKTFGKFRSLQLWGNPEIGPQDFAMDHSNFSHLERLQVHEGFLPQLVESAAMLTSLGYLEVANHGSSASAETWQKLIERWPRPREFLVRTGSLDDAVVEAMQRRSWLKTTTRLAFGCSEAGFDILLAMDLPVLREMHPLPDSQISRQFERIHYTELQMTEVMGESATCIRFDNVRELWANINTLSAFLAMLERTKHAQLRRLDINLPTSGSKTDDWTTTYCRLFDQRQFAAIEHLSVVWCEDERDLCDVQTPLTALCNPAVLPRLRSLQLTLPELDDRPTDVIRRLEQRPGVTIEVY